ncbi:MAG TPA: methyltransferase domain-containing protein [Solirubrobacteraceae bacterium]
MAEDSGQDTEVLERWRRAASGWSSRADEVRDFGMPVSAWMIDQLALQPGQRVLELAAGPGDTGFMAAELVNPGGTLISSDGVEPMLDIARERAGAMGISNVEFKQLDLEWIDLETASVDALLCRWGLMFAPDPGSSLQEMRRVLRPGGRVALAVWAAPEGNPWATIPTRALIELGHVEPPDPNAPGMFVLADAERLRELLDGAGFLEPVVEPIALMRTDDDVRHFIQGTLDLSAPLAEVHDRLSDEHWSEVEARIAELAQPFATEDGRLAFPAVSLGAAASS